MKYIAPSKESDLFSMIDHQQKMARTTKGINKLSIYIQWEDFREELESILGYNTRDLNKGGRPPFDPVFMFKVLVLQKYHGLSDEATQDQIADRFSFMKFLGVHPGDSIPDRNTIWDFKKSLEINGRKGSKRLFKLFQKMLSNRGVISREGSIVDASFIAAPRQRNSRSENEEIKQGNRPEDFKVNAAKNRQKDCDARWSKKKNETHYGYKNHIKVDAKTKLIIECTTTAANVHDSKVFKDLVNKEDQAIFADSAYQSQENEDYVLGPCDSQEFIILKANRNQPLSEAERLINKRRSRIRVRVEHVFARMSQFCMDQLQSIGLKRAHYHNNLSNLIYNMDRYAFLCK